MENKIMFKAVSVAKELEIGDQPIQLNIGPSKSISLELKRPSAEEIKKGSNRISCSCIALKSFEISLADLEVFKKIEDNKILSSEEQWKAVLQYDDASGNRIFVPHLANFPEHFSQRINEIFNEFKTSLSQAIKVLRWRTNRSAVYDGFSLLGLKWSSDGVFWHPLPGDISVRIRAVDGALKLSSDEVIELESLLQCGVQEPLYHELYRQADAEKTRHFRSTLINGVSALEVGVKRLISNLAQDADWFVFDVPAPPVVKMLTNYIPKRRSKTTGQIIGALPEKLIKEIRWVNEIRNELIHKGDPIKDRKRAEEALDLIQDFLWWCDYHSGVIWAGRYIRNASLRQTITIF